MSKGKQENLVPERSDIVKSVIGSQVGNYAVMYSEAVADLQLLSLENEKLRDRIKELEEELVKYAGDPKPKKGGENG